MKKIVRLQNSFLVKPCGGQVIWLYNFEKSRFWKLTYPERTKQSSLTYRVLQRRKLPKLWQGQQIKVISSCSFYFGDLSRLNERENFECQWLYNYLLSVICDSRARKQYVSILSQKIGQENIRSNFFCLWIFQKGNLAYKMGQIEKNKCILTY